MSSNLSEMLGSWRLLHVVRVCMSGQSFELPQGAVVVVTQVDDTRHKVLVEAGPRTVDWLHVSWLEKHCKQLL